MTKIVFSFDRDKAIEAVLYLAHRVTPHDVYGLCKLLYLVDKTSLERYGRFVFGESYSAMKEGATPSHTYDLFKEVRERAIKAFRIEGNDIMPMRDADIAYLSESDTQCLDQIVSIYGQVPNWVRARDCHDDAWRESWDAKGDKNSNPISVESIVETLTDAEDLADYLANRDAE